MAEDQRPAAEVVDEVRREYRAGRIDRSSAILHIQMRLSLTELGAADLLDHPTDAQVRYEALTARPCNLRSSAPRRRELTPVFGPYEEERQAYADAPYRDSENAKERRNGCAELLRAVCREAGVELGDYDEEIVRLLSRLGPEVVQVVAGMISRAGAR